MESLGLDSWCLLAAVTMLGACFQGSVGFGLSFTVVPLLTFLEPVAIPTVPLLVALPLLVGTVIRDLPDLDLRGSGWLVLGRFPGTVMGAALLWAISPELARCFGWHHSPGVSYGESHACESKTLPGNASRSRVCFRRDGNRCWNRRSADQPPVSK